MVWGCRLISVSLNMYKEIRMYHLEILKRKLNEIPKEGILIPMQGGEFTVKPVVLGDHLVGVNVSNLGNYPFLPMDVFTVTLTLLEIKNNKTARKGEAMKFRLGDAELGFDSVEGLIAKIVYGKDVGDTVFRRITPISRILQWAGVCKSQNGSLVLVS